MNGILNEVELDRYRRFLAVHSNCYEKAYDKRFARNKKLPPFLRKPLYSPSLILHCYLNNGIGPAYDIICPHCKSKQSITDYSCW